MLQVKNICKKYVTGSLVQTALNDVSLNLRNNEFVAILGPSGSGKTTLLNVIGGLDRYDSGDLIINGISTKKYSDRDWDSYRNHTVGFIFQSYNLIPHQSVLANVELALTISGISRRERRKRAKNALEQVGLGNQIHKRPNQMSGGQMQRVAIARALVNNPDILLADEPTGALDSDTSIQVMELLKEVSKDRLVVMVTHNPELAEQYASRIVRVRDGVILDDTNPFTVNEEELAPPEHKNMGKASMSFFTALALSFNNLWTKKARTLLTSFAGSIGIIGIALILSLTTGFQNYIDKIQEDTLSTYPLTIQSETADMTAMLTTFGGMAAAAGEAEEAEESDVVKEQQIISQMFAQIGSNDLRSFKKYLDGSMDEIGDAINALRYEYSVTPQLYAFDTADGVEKVNPGNLFSTLTGNPMMGSYMDSSVFSEMLENRELLDSQYDMLAGKWPESYDEMVMVLSDPNSMSDYTAYTLGLCDKDELSGMINDLMEGKEVENIGEPMEWTYDELLKLRFRLVLLTDTYKYNSEYAVWEDMSDDEEYMKNLVNSGDELKIVGIVSPKEGVSASALTPGVAYTHELTEHIMNAAENARMVKDQIANEEVDVFSGKRFDDESKDSGLDFSEMFSVDTGLLSSAFGMNMGEDFFSDMLSDLAEEMAGTVDMDSTPAQADFNELLARLAKGMLSDYIGRNTDPATGKAMLRLSDAQTIAGAYLATPDAQKQIKALEGKYLLPEGALAQVYNPLLIGLISQYVTANTPAPEIPEIPETPEEPEIPETPDQPVIPDAVQPEPQSEPQPEEPQPEPQSEPQPEPPTELRIGRASGSGIDSLIPEDFSLEDLPIDISGFAAEISADDIDGAVAQYMSNAVVSGASAAMAVQMTEAVAQQQTISQMGSLTDLMVQKLASSFSVDAGKIASAFKFNFDEDELTRLMGAFATPAAKRSYDSNLRTLGYADRENPSAIFIYLVDFAGKERFLDFIDSYNADMEEKGNDDMVINYTDMTGVLMSSVKVIVDSVSYVLIAFVAVSLVVSSIMIGIITYISVIERTKEIGVLRAIGASKRNVSQVFNAETFIVGLCAGLIGVGVTLLLIPVINSIIHSLTGANDINAVLPTVSAAILTLLSMGLTMLGGLIPSKKASRQDPVIALRSE